ncbi:Hypothetical protein SMB2099_1565 [Serratia marcescens SMB2099]|nr:Hypothetical protein SMB2099_1565 [Serratia marcescens SMB2099]
MLSRARTVCAGERGEAINELATAADSNINWMSQLKLPPI